MSKKVALSLVVALCALVLAAPTYATEARDMKGNKVMIDDQTGFTYGGDNTGGYAGNKIATGKKDPAVCGTFKSSTCSIKYTNK